MRKYISFLTYMVTSDVLCYKPIPIIYMVLQIVEKNKKINHNKTTFIWYINQNLS